MIQRQRLAVICPVYNEGKALEYFFGRFAAMHAELSKLIDCELVFVNNASTDDTYGEIQRLRARWPWVSVITHSRNFGYQASVLCGIKRVEADLYVVIDVDCEDPPELIPGFVAKWREGYDLVYGQRISRPEHFLVVAARRLFYLGTRMIADSDFILYMAEFSLFSRRIREHVISHQSTFPFVRSDLAYAGFRRWPVPYARERRRFGRTHYNFRGMFRFAVAGLLSASTFPLRAIAYLGLPLALLDFFYSVASLFGFGPKIGAVVALNLAFFAGSLGFLAIYLARVSKDVVGRPMFIVDESKTFLRSETRPDFMKVVS